MRTRGRKRAGTIARAGWLCGTLWLGCTFGGGSGASGIASSTGADDTAGDGADASGDTSPTDSGPQPATITTPSDAGPDNDESASDDGATADSGSTDTSAIDCDQPPFYKEVVLATDAVTVDPMMQWPVPALPGGACVGSEAQSEGTAAFVWHPPCDGDYYLWARVWDDFPAALGSDDPDSYFVRTDDGDEIMWRYGCQTVNDITQPGAWYWLPVEASTTCVLGKSNETYAAKAGPHSFVFRNRERGTYDPSEPPGHVAAIARILVTNDPTYVPMNDE